MIRFEINGIMGVSVAGALMLFDKSPSKLN